MNKLSVCIATYNGEHYIKDQIESILPQLNPTDEIIISDNFSSDKTIEIIKGINDPRIIISINKQRHGVIANFEESLKLSCGDIIFLADQDDVWRIDKVEKSLKLLMHHDLLVSDCIITDVSLKTLYPSYFKIINSKRGLIRNLFHTNPYMGCCMAFKRSVLNKALPFPRKIPMHDYWIGMVGEAFFSTIFTSEKLVYYRRHSQNTSSTGVKSKRSLKQKMQDRLQIMTALILRSLNYT